MQFYYLTLEQLLCFLHVSIYLYCRLWDSSDVSHLEIQRHEVWIIKIINIVRIISLKGIFFLFFLSFSAFFPRRKCTLEAGWLNDRFVWRSKGWFSSIALMSRRGANRVKLMCPSVFRSAKIKSYRCVRKEWGDTDIRANTPLRKKIE